MKIQELMSSKVQSIKPDATITEAARTMSKTDVGTLPIVDGGQLMGIITDRDICCRVIGEDLDPGTTRVDQIMTKDVASCFSDQDITDAAQLMESKHIRRLAVMNRDNSLAGLISVDDLARGSHDLAGEVLESSMHVH